MMSENFFRFGLLTTVFGGFLSLTHLGAVSDAGVLFLVLGYLFGIMALPGSGTPESTSAE